MNNNIGQADLKLLKELYPTKYPKLIKKLEKNYPIQYLIGYVDFYNLKLIVNKHTLIPRFETELLVEKAIKYLATKNYKNILDIGTGSGAIAIAIKKNLNIDVDACDVSSKALKVANKNALNNNVNINFYKLNILKDIPNQKYDCLISNPPYVKEDEIVSPETKYEPKIALYAKEDGLEFYKRIINISKNILNENGSLILEIGSTQSKIIKDMILKTYPNSEVLILKDYNNFDRFIFATI